jgi:uncharacterized membrane protein
MKLTVAPAPLDSLGRACVVIVAVFLLLIWVIGIFAYKTMPDRIPTHFDFSGNPDAFGNRLTFLLLPVAFSLAPVIILLIVRFRFTLVNRFPYLVSLPAFFSQIGQLPEERRSYWLNKYFGFVAAVGVAVSAFLLALFLGIYAGTLEGSMPWWFTVITVAIPIILIVSFIIALRAMSLRLQDEIG